MPLELDPIMSGRSIWSFRNLKCQNPFIISDSRSIQRWLQKMGKKSEEQEQEES